MKTLILSVIAATCVAALIFAEQVVVSGRTSVAGQVRLGSSAMTVVVISDEHMEFNPYESVADVPLNYAKTSPSDLVNRARAENPDVLIVNGDLGHNSLPAEYNGFFVQSATAVTTTGTATVVTTNPSPSYSEYGMKPHASNYLVGSSDAPTTLLYNTSWVAVYDDATGKNFEIVQVSSVSGTQVTATFTKTHPVGFLMRCHAMSEYWDYMLQGKVIMSDGNHDVNCSIAEGSSNVFVSNGCSNDPNGPQSVLTYLQLGFQNSSALPFSGYSSTIPVGSYYSKVVSPLLGVIAIDSMAGQTSNGGLWGSTGWGGTNYGQPQELALRCALSGGTGAGCGGSGALAATWIVTTQHYMPANSCSFGGIAPWAMNSAVDMSLAGHTHLAQYIVSPRCGGSGCTNVTGPGGTTSIPVLDVSSYTYMTNDPMNECSPLSTYCPGCTRPVLNSASLNTTGDKLGIPFRSYVKMILTPHTLTWSMIDNNGKLVCDYVNTGTCAAGVLTK